MKIKLQINILFTILCLQASLFGQVSESNTAIKATLFDVAPAPTAISKKTSGEDIIFLLEGEYKTKYTFKLNVEALNDYELIAPASLPISGETEVPGVEHSTPYNATKVENPAKTGKIIVKVVGKWLPHSKVFTPSAKIGTLKAGGDLTVGIKYTLNWDARLCGAETQYRNLKWTYNTARYSSMAVLKKDDVINYQPEFGQMPGVGVKVKNGAVHNETIPNNNLGIVYLDIGNTVSWSTDHMRIDALRLDFGNHTTPPANIVSGANPQFASVTKEGTELEFIDSGHSLIIGVYDIPTNTVLRQLPVFVFLGPVSHLKNPAIIIP